MDCDKDHIEMDRDQMFQLLCSKIKLLTSEQKKMVLAKCKEITAKQ